MYGEVAQMESVGSLEAARRIGVTQKTILRMAKSGELKAFTIGGGRLRIDRAELERFVQSRQVVPAA